MRRHITFSMCKDKHNIYMLNEHLGVNTKVIVKVIDNLAISVPNNISLQYIGY